MKGLLLKELFNFKKISKNILFIVVLYALLSISMPSMSFFCSMTVAIFSMFIITSFSYDEYSKWEQYALALPLTRNKLVSGKYIYAFMLCATGLVTSIIIAILTSVFQQGSSLIELIASVIGALYASILLIDICIPLIYKFGAEKYRIILFGVVLVILIVPMGAMYLLNYIVNLDTIFNTLNSMSLPLLIVIATSFIILVTYISYTISKRVYNRKDI